MFASFGIRYCVDSSNHYTSCFKAAVICRLLAATSVYSVTTILLLLIMVLVVLIVLMLIRCQGCHSELHIVAEKGVTILYITSRKLCIVITAVAYHLTNILRSLSQSKLHFDKVLYHALWFFNLQTYHSSTSVISAHPTITMFTIFNHMHTPIPISVQCTVM